MSVSLNFLLASAARGARHRHSFRCLRQMSTVYALSSGHGKCGVSLVRVSGPASLTALQALTKKTKHVERRATLSKLSTNDGIVLDHALTIWFPAPNSFTGEQHFKCSCTHNTGFLLANFSKLKRTKTQGFPKLKQNFAKTQAKKF